MDVLRIMRRTLTLVVVQLQSISSPVQFSVDETKEAQKCAKTKDCGEKVWRKFGFSLPLSSLAAASSFFRGTGASVGNHETA